MVSTADAPTQGLPRISKVAAFLGASEGDVTGLLEEGRLDGALLTMLRSRGVSVTPNVKNSVQMLIRVMASEHGVAATVQPASNPLSLSATSTIMFTDVVDSTALIQRLGDRASRRLLSGHSEVKSLGDGFMLVFRSSSQAISCAIAAQRAITQRNASHSQIPISVRMGLSVGEPVQGEDEDLHGMPVIKAARIAAAAKGGQVLACQITYVLASSAVDRQFRPLGPITLKGIEGKHPVFEVLWRETDAT